MTESTNVGAFQCQAYQGLPGLAQISDVWRMLAGQCDQPSFFHYPEWYECYLNCLAPNPDSVFFCVLHRAGELVAVAPLERRDTQIGRSLVFPQDIMHVAAGDITAARTENPGEVAGALLEGCASLPELRWDRVCLDLVPESSYCATAFQALHDRRQVRRFMRYSNRVVLQPFDQMLRGFSESTRKRLRQTKRHLDRAGEVRFQTTCGVPDLASTVEIFMDVEASGWKGEAGTAIKCCPQLRAFYRMLATRFGGRGQCDIHSLFVNDQPVAALFVLHAGEIAQFLKIGYDEGYASLSPGNTIDAYAMQYYYEKTSVRIVDFMSDYAYLRMWNPARYRIVSVAVFDRGWTGRLAYHATIGTHAIQKVYGATIGPVVQRTLRRLRTAPGANLLPKVLKRRAQIN